MKISTLLEMATPASMPDNNTSAPKFGRSDEMLESGVGTTTSGAVASDSKPMGKMRTRGQGSMFKGISTSSKYVDDRIQIRKWLAVALLKRVFGGQPDNVLTNIRKIIQESNSTCFPASEIVNDYRNHPSYFWNRLYCGLAVKLTHEGDP